MTIPATMRAIRVRGPNDLFIDYKAPVPTVRPGYLLVKVLCVALNPADWKRAAIFKEDRPHTLGCDVVGTIITCGGQVDQDYRPGDRVAGLCYGMKPGDPTSGAFGEYALLKGALSLRVPDHMSNKEAATIPVGINFAGQALYQALKLPLPCCHIKYPLTRGPSLLVYGGATATGMVALQFARLSGCRVLTTCSPRNFQLVKALGAHEAFDYHDPNACAAAIREVTDDNLLYALDCISTPSSLQICAKSLTSRSNVATYNGTLPLSENFPRDDVQFGWVSGYTAFGEGTHLAGKFEPANPADLAFATNFWRLTAELLQQDRLRLAPLVHDRDGGLPSVLDGLFELKSGWISAGKLVYTVAD